MFLNRREEFECHPIDLKTLSHFRRHKLKRWYAPLFLQASYITLFLVRVGRYHASIVRKPHKKKKEQGSFLPFPSYSFCCNIINLLRVLFSNNCLITSVNFFVKLRGTTNTMRKETKIFYGHRVSSQITLNT